MQKKPRHSKGKFEYSIFILPKIYAISRVSLTYALILAHFFTIGILRNLSLDSVNHSILAANTKLLTFVTRAMAAPNAANFLGTLVYVNCHTLKKQVLFKVNLTIRITSSAED